MKAESNAEPNEADSDLHDYDVVLYFGTHATARYGAGPKTKVMKR